jgi:hypothetical protein
MIFNWSLFIENYGLKNWRDLKIGETFDVYEASKQLPPSQAYPRKGIYQLTRIPISETDLYHMTNKLGEPKLSRQHWEWDNYDNYQTELLDNMINDYDIIKNIPIIVEKTTSNYHVIDGHHRLTVANELGEKNILALVRLGSI